MERVKIFSSLSLRLTTRGIVRTVHGIAKGLFLTDFAFGYSPALERRNVRSGVSGFSSLLTHF